MATIPAGMKAVTEKEFFAALYADKRDIMPRSQPDHSSWEVVATRERWGFSTPGWRCEGPEVFAICAA